MSSISSKKAALHNLGCKVNSYELELMAQELRAAGCSIVPFDEPADIYIVNTCSVTNMADRKSRQMLSRARSLSPDAVVVAVGCYAQSRGAREMLSRGVDIVAGNSRKGELVRLLEEYFDNSSGIDAVSPMGEERSYDPHERLLSTMEHTRAYVKVEDGCNQFCSYCIIPFLRGRVRSRDEGEIIEEVRHLAAGGCREVVLTGINLSAYGSDTGSTLISLAGRLSEIEDLERIRLSSLEPRILTHENVSALAFMPKVCPHFHLSLQSGCARTLERMNRKYTPEEFFEAAEGLRSEFERIRGTQPALTADVIVGFPGETEGDFEECRAFLERTAFFETHVFKYSPRQGTRAAAMEGQLTDREKTRRSHILLELSKKNRDAFTQKLLGSPLFRPEVLIEESREIRGSSWQVGHTGEYLLCALKSPEDLSGRIVSGKLTGEYIRSEGRDICIIGDFEVK